MAIFNKYCIIMCITTVLTKVCESQYVILYYSKAKHAMSTVYLILSPL